MIRHDTPFTGDPHDIVAQHRELTGRTRLASRWWRRQPVVEFEVAEYVTVEHGARFDSTLCEHRQRTEWVRS